LKAHIRPPIQIHHTSLPSIKMQSLLRLTSGSAFRPMCTPYSTLFPRTYLQSITRPFRSHTSKLPTKPTSKTSSFRSNRWIGAGAIAAVGLHMSLMPRLNLEPGPPVAQVVAPTAPVPAPSVPPSTQAAAAPPPPPIQSSLNLYQLSFGTVCGICAGVFVKKGAKAVAFFLGGVFVVLQYFTSFNLLTVNWGSIASRFEQQFHTIPSAPGEKSEPPTVLSLWNWLVDFLTADFPPRATFLAGFILGLRVG